MTHPLTLIALGELVLVLLGVLTGNGYTTRRQDVRDRKQNARQRQLNEQTRSQGD